jgi:DNA-binding CsgD family transcriptional regulator
VTRTFQDLLQDILFPHSEEIRRFTQPLRDHLGIDYFTYHFVSNEGGYGAIVDQLDYAEFYVGQEYYRRDPYLCAPQGVRPGVTHWSSVGTPEYTAEVLKIGEERFGLTEGVMVARKRATGGVEFFGFASQRGSHLYTLVLSHRPLLERFFSNFRSQLKSLIGELEEEPISLPAVKGDAYYLSLERSDEAFKKFSNSLGVKAGVELSCREEQCLQLYRDGLTALETAERLGLSQRTVESYFESVKNKTGCDYKRDLLAILP